MLKCWKLVRGGYNTLAFFHWGCRHIDLVEANATGISDMRNLFEEKKIAKNIYDIIPCKIEEYHTDKKYDIIIAEGFLHFLSDQQVIIDKMKKLINKNGIIVITCSDHASLFIEDMKRIIGLRLAKDRSGYEEKVQYLTKLFAPQLAKLKGVSRSAKDWVQDMILNPVISSNTELSMATAIRYFEKDFDVLGSSPVMFTDYSWYKDIWYDYKENYIEQFEEKRHSLIMANMPELKLTLEQSEILTDQFQKIREIASCYEKDYDSQYLREILGELDLIETYIKYFDQEFIDVFCDIKDALTKILETGFLEMDNYVHLYSAFGRTQQYMSFIKQ